MYYINLYITTRVGKIPWRRERLPTLVFWPREFHGLYSPWGRRESDTTDRLSLSLPSIRVFSNESVLCIRSIKFLALSLLYGPIFISVHDYWKSHNFNYMGKVMSLLFNMLSRFVTAFLPRSKRLLIL